MNNVKEKNHGKIVQVMGPVVDVEFENNDLPFIKDALEVYSEGKRLVSVAIMPCTAKKYEIQRPDMEAVPGCKDIDVSITTRELGDMIKRAGIDFTALPDEKFDPIFGIASGAADIFGVTGGVMEAALRTAVEELTGEELEKVERKEEM